jgi:transcriptional regulator
MFSQTSLLDVWEKYRMGRDTLLGTLDLLILKTLARGPEHGYGITCAILAASQNQLRVEEGSLYPALRRMESDGLIKAEWKASENNRRARYYRLTKAGERRLADIVRRWQEHTAAVATFLEFA